MSAPKRVRGGIGVFALMFCIGLVPAPGHGEIFRWIDDDGRVHFGDRPPADTRPEALGLSVYRAPEVDKTTVFVARVYDGDTFETQSGERVRLDGINTPETAKRSQAGDPLADDAKALLVKLIDARQVQLRFGDKPRDKYKRLLATVYLGGRNINLALVEAGLAHVAIHPPAPASSDALIDAERAARAARRGIWALPGYQIRGTEKLLAERNRFQRVRARVRSVREKKSAWVLYLDDQFELYLPKSGIDDFRRAGLLPGSLLGREIVVRGWIRQRKGVPWIKLIHSSQIESVG